jgi:hypothetical protein
MTVQTSEILDALMGGSSSQSLQARIEELSKKDRRELLCTICCLRDEIANNCLERAAEVDLVLSWNGHLLPPNGCGIREFRGGMCHSLQPCRALRIMKSVHQAL